MAKHKDQISGAYKPKKPYRSVEGIGSMPWKKLSRDAVFVLNKFYEKFNGYNRYDLSLTYDEVKSKISNRPFSNALLELLAFGFIDIKRPGRLERECSIYGLSNRWRRLEPKILDDIEVFLKEIKNLKRKPGEQKKRMRINELRKKILDLGTGISGKYIDRSRHSRPEKMAPK